MSSFGSVQPIKRGIHGGRLLKMAESEHGLGNHKNRGVLEPGGFEPVSPLPAASRAETTTDKRAASP